MSAAIASGAAIGFGARTTHARRTPSSAPRSRLRITARGRAVVLSLLALPLVAAALVFGIGAGAASGSSSSTPLSRVTVVGGETLWGLAHEVAPNADPDDVIANIMAVNQLKSADIQPGEQLEIPAQYAHTNG